MKFRTFAHAFLACAAAAAMAGCPIGAADAPLTVPTATVSGSAAATSPTPTGNDLARQFPTCRDPSQADSWRAEILFMVNRERAIRGLDPLVLNQTLEQQATQYACEMIQYNFFAHENPVTGSTLPDRAAEFAYDYLVIGENLAAGQESPVQVMREWMASPGHTANIVDARFTEIGIGVRAGGEFGFYWVQEFGLPTRTQSLLNSP